MDHRKGRPALLISLFIAAYILVPQIWALTLTVTPIQANYGQNIKLSASSPQYSADNIELYINNTLIANAIQQVNYTICISGPCLLPGTHGITALDNTTKESKTTYLVISPTYPSFSFPSSKLQYGKSETITASAAYFNDSVTLFIGNSGVASGTGDISYQICANGKNCLQIGTYNVSVRDNTENVWSATNQVITITAIEPSITIQQTSIRYGSRDTITAKSSVATDTVSIRYGSSTLATGTGSVTYIICNSSSSPCLDPSTYALYAADSSSGANSSIINLTVAPAALQVSLQSPSVQYGVSDKITAKAPNQNDAIQISVNGTRLNSSTGSVNYVVCSAEYDTKCLAAGMHSVSVYDSSEGAYYNTSLLITPVLPSISVGKPMADYGSKVLINGTAPYYSDTLSLMIGNSTVANGTGVISYTVCGQGNDSCIPPGDYNILIYDKSEGVNSIALPLDIISTNGMTSALTSAPTSTVATNQSVSGSGPLGNITALDVLAIIVIAVLVIALLFLIFRK